jgi:hypothetical protein
MLPCYRAFRESLQGYVEVPFKTFKEELYPLRSSRVWTADQRQRVAALHAQGAGAALAVFFGADHDEARAILGPAPAPPPMPRAELDRYLQRLLRSCRAGSWPPEEFTRFERYLDGELDLKGQTASDPFAVSYRAAPAAYKAVVRAALEKGRQAARPAPAAADGAGRAGLAAPAGARPP